MSRARLVRDSDGDVARFDWKTAKPAPPPGPVVVEAPPPPKVAPAAAAPEPITQDQKEHLAALEREAFTKGYAQGERAGLEAGGKRAEAMLRRVAQTLEELAGLRTTLMQQSERQMVQLALTLARRIVGREIALDPELIAAMAHVAITKLGTANPATIRLHPEDYTIVARDGERWAGAQVTVIPDPSIARGGCMVESDFGCIDASLDRQFEEMTRALLGERMGE
jgi:flagellar assembly protein FliH